MKIQVEDARSGGAESRDVKFSCALGQGVGQWASWATPPLKGAHYDVELDVNVLLAPGRNATPTRQHQYQIFTINDQIILRGSVEARDEDGMVYFRLGGDCLIMIESDDDSIRPGNWFELSVSPADIEISPQEG